MDNTGIYNPSIFPSQPVIGSQSEFPRETTSLNNPGLAPQHPNTIGTGVDRGTKTLAGTQIIANADGTFTYIGLLPTNEYGIAFLDASLRITQKIVGGVTYFYDVTGNLVQKIAGATTSFYDPKNSYVNSQIQGLLPDGSSGLVIAKAGVAATSLFA